MKKDKKDLTPAKGGKFFIEMLRRIPGGTPSLGFGGVFYLDRPKPRGEKFLMFRRSSPTLR